MTNDKDNRKQPTEKEAQNHRHYREGLTPEELTDQLLLAIQVRYFLKPLICVLSHFD